MLLSVGSRLGPYQIEMPLGAGGMGQVYKATDTRLGRTVAVKVLLRELTSNEELRQRFQREARTISSLSHPNICALFDVGEHEGIDFLVMEYLEGVTLAERLSNGPLSIDQLYRYAIEIADALDRAHRIGIIHRDLKPGNIMITKSGAKLLDFGLAKLVAGNELQASNLSTLETNTSLTAEGKILGTVQYMAPEQLEGKQADARTDIFALGAVLYEMATRRKAFSGASQAAVFAGILSSEPVFESHWPSQIHPAFRRVVMRCLAKDPEDRWQAARDVVLELKSISEQKSPLPIAKTERSSLRKNAPWMLAGLFFLLSLYLYSTRSFSHRSGSEFSAWSADPVRFTVPPPDNTSYDGSIALSSDGKRLAFTATNADGKTLLYIRLMDNVTARPIAGTEDASFPFWSPYGRQLAFFARDKLKKVDFSSDSVETICDVNDARGGTWNQNGVILFSQFAGGAIYKVPERGGSATEIVSLNQKRGEGSIRFPCFLPDGQQFLYYSLSEKDSAVYIGALNSKETRLLLRSDSGAQYASGCLFYFRGRALMGQPFDPKRMEISGEPFLVSENVWWDSWVPGYVAFSVSNNKNVVAFRSGGMQTSQFVLYDRSGKELAKYGEPSGVGEPALSPDGKILSVSRGALMKKFTGDIWLLELMRGTMSRFTFGDAYQVNSLWTPDGKSIVFAGYPHPGIYRMALTGGKPQVLLEPGTYSAPEDISPDGRFLIYSALDLKTNKTDLWTFPMSGEGKAKPYLQTEFNEDSGQLSPDGRWLAYISDESGRPEVYVQTFPSPGNKVQISNNGAADKPQWRNDGKELFYVAPDRKLMAVDITNGSTLQAGTPHTLFQTEIKQRIEARNHYAATRDGRQFFINTPLKEITTAPIVVLLNWNPELNRR